MKKVIVTFLCIASILSWVTTYSIFDNKELSKIQNNEEQIAYSFKIPQNRLLVDSEKIYPILLDTAEEHKVNIFRTTVKYDLDDKAQIIKYILITSDNTKFYNNIKLDSGRVLIAEETKNGDKYMSTSDENDKNIIGRIHDFGNNNIIIIKPLKECYNSLPLSGIYYAETTNKEAFQKFISDFSKKLSEQGIDLGLESFDVSVGEKVEINDESKNYISNIKNIILVIILILALYYVFNESKKIGIMKLNGLHSLRIWLGVIGQTIFSWFFITTILSLVMALLLTNNKDFIFSIIIYQCKLYLSVFVILMLPYIYISKNKIGYAIKNKKDTRSILVINIVVKIISLVIIFTIINNILSQYSELRLRRKNLEGWQYAKNYGVFYPLKNGNDDLGKDDSATFANINTQLYKFLNANGAILINAYTYEEEFLELNPISNDEKYSNYIKVNNNYLKEFPIYDENNNKIEIEESTSERILLVPSRYKSHEKEILEQHKAIVNGWIDLEENYYHLKVSEEMKNISFRIIWIKDGQDVFSFNPNVYKSQGNNIKDPVILVITEDNSFIADRSTILGKGTADPLKVKLMNRDTELTYKAILPTLRELNLDDNLTTLVGIDEEIIKEIYNMEKDILSLIFIGLILLTIIIIIIIQSIVIFFNKNEREFVVNRLFGVSFIKTYKKYALLFLSTWLIPIVGYCIVEKSIRSNFILVITTISLIELLISIILILAIESKNKVKVLKGGC